MLCVKKSVPMDIENTAFPLEILQAEGKTTIGIDM
jgi:hypothetical protein